MECKDGHAEIIIWLIDIIESEYGTQFTVQDCMYPANLGQALKSLNISFILLSTLQLDKR